MIPNRVNKLPNHILDDLEYWDDLGVFIAKILLNKFSQLEYMRKIILKIYYCFPDSFTAWIILLRFL